MRGYSGGIRPVYGDDEQAPGERLANGVGSAIGSYLDRRDQGTQFRNQVRAVDPDATFEEEESPWTRMMARHGRTSLGRRVDPNSMPSQPPAMDPASLPQVNRGAPGGMSPGRSPIGDAIQRSMVEGPNGTKGYYDPTATARQQASISLATDAAKQRIAAQYKDQPLTASDRVNIARAGRSDQNTVFQHQISLERMRQDGANARAALAAGRGSNVQLTTLRSLQTSLDGQVREIAMELEAARRTYDDDAVTSLTQLLDEARTAAEENRQALASTGIAGSSAAPRSGPSDADRQRDNVRQRQRYARRRPAPSSPQARPNAPAPSSGSRTVPPPVRP